MLHLFVLAQPVIVQSDSNDLIALGSSDTSSVVSLAINLRESPDLQRGPAGLLVDRKGLHDLALRQPILLEPGVFNELAVGGKESRLSNDIAEDMVGVLSLGPVQLAFLRRALDPARGNLLDINAGHAVLLIFLDVQSDAGVCNGCAGQPAQSLKDEDWVDVIGAGLVLNEGGKVD